MHLFLQSNWFLVFPLLGYWYLMLDLFLPAPMYDLSNITCVGQGVNSTPFPEER